MLPARHLVFGLLGLLLAPAAPATAQDEKPPSRYDTGKLVKQFFEVPQEERAETLRRLRLLKPLRKSELKNRIKELRKLSRRAGPRLEKSGEGWFYDEESRRGRYIVAGNGREGLFVGLHGGGRGSGDAASAASALRSAAGSQDWTAIFPEVLEKTERGWTDGGTEQFVIELIEAALRTFDLPPDRVYLGGHSMGGYGTWVIGAHHADRFAALAVWAGAPTPIYGPGGRMIAIQDGVLPNLRNLPLHVYQSLDDPRVGPETNQFAVAELGRLRERDGGYPCVYQEVDGRGHGYPQGGPQEALAWAAEHVRDPCPEKIVWEPALSWKQRFYWLRWQQPVKGARLLAECRDNVVEITCDREAKGLSVLLDERLVDLKKTVTVRVDGEVAFEGLLEPSLAALLACAGESVDSETWFACEVRLP